VVKSAGDTDACDAAVLELPSAIGIHQLHGTKGVLRSTLAFQVTERNGVELLAPPPCCP
jgi:hypothetical protein